MYSFSQQDVFVMKISADLGKISEEKPKKEPNCLKSGITYSNIFFKKYEDFMIYIWAIESLKITNYPNSAPKIS